jgi:uncharacterized protein YjiS (DUF1127 family)
MMEPAMSALRRAFPGAHALANRLHRAGASVACIPASLLHRAALAHSRRSLLRLDDHLLHDIGLSRHEAKAEAERRGWDAPSHWKG